ncbi:hypothetical protein D3C72_1748440 [compost metagenome]
MEAVTQGEQFLAQFGVVVDGAVEHHGQSQFGVQHGLPGGFGEVHDLQPSMAQGDRSLAVQAPRVRAAGREVVGDSIEGGQIGRLFVEA